MGLATHLGPWLLGTVKNTTGTTAGTVRNTGATVVVQQVTLVASTAVTVMLPAGALVLDVKTYMTTGAAGTPAVTIGGVTIGTVSTAAGTNSLSSAGTTAGAAAMSLGATDTLLSYTATAASAGVLAVVYVVRNSDGTIAPTAFTGP